MARRTAAMLQRQRKRMRKTAKMTRVKKRPPSETNHGGRSLDDCFVEEGSSGACDGFTRPVAGRAGKVSVWP